MALNTIGDIETEFLVRNNRTTTDSWITDAILDDWIRQALNWATSYKRWPFTDARISTTFTSAEEWSFEGVKTDSIRFIQIGGKRLKKLNFEDYQTFKEEESSSTDRYYSDYGRTVFINPRVDLSGTLTVYGQFLPTVDPTDVSATTVFSGNEDEGNDAVVEKMSYYLRLREHLPDEAINHEKLAKDKLDGIWGRIQGEQAMYHTHKDSGGMWERMDIVGGLTDTDENQF